MANVHTEELGAGLLASSLWVPLFTVPTGFVYVVTCVDITAEQGATFGTCSGRFSQDITSDPLVLAFTIAMVAQYYRGFWHWTGRRQVPEGATWSGWKDPGDTDVVSYRITGYKLSLP